MIENKILKQILVNKYKMTDNNMDSKIKNIFDTYGYDKLYKFYKGDALSTMPKIGKVRIKLITEYFDNQEKKENNNISKMNVKDFFDLIENQNNNDALYRHINVSLKEIKGKMAKIPKGEKNDLTIKEIKNNRGNTNYNTLSLSIKHIEGLYMVDFDTKEVVDCEFYERLNDDCVATTETTKGSHYYIKIKNIGAYKQQQKIYYNNDIDLDLIKTNNCWETKNRIVTGEIKEYDWNDIKKYFNIERMNFANSPPASPPTTPKKKKKKIVKKEEEEHEEEIDFIEPVIQPKKVNINELREMLDNMNHEDLYEYDTWIKIGLAIFNITDGSEEGKELYIDWSSTDDNGADIETIETNWDYWTKSKGKSKNKVGYTCIKDFYNKYKPTDTSTLQQIFRRYIDPNNPKDFREAITKMLQELNNRLIFVKETGDFIILDKKQRLKEDGEIESRDCWFLKTTNKVKDHFAKENFTYYFDDGNGGQDFEIIKPFNLWMEWDYRREVSEIGFDPQNKCKDIFNLWNGFAVSKEVADSFDESEAEPILHHIKELWANDDEEVYNYILNLFAHYIQKPHIKTGVLLALKSKQGGGKGIILDKLAKIIGDEHYIQNSNAEYLFGNFNGQLEGKIVCNLDEAFWGGDKKKEGVVKNKITETRQTINKKNKEAYKVDDYVNYIITTNNDWFAGVSEDDRRHYCIELNNMLSGRMTENTLNLVQPVLDAPCEAFAKVLYNRDISDFKPRIFKKTPLLQNQVEMGWTSVKTWYNMVMRDGGFIYNHKGNQQFIQWGNLIENEYDTKPFGGQFVRNKKTKQKITAYCKDWIFECYNQTASDNRKFSKEAFYRELKKNCLRESDDLLIERKLQIKKSRKPYLFLPSIEKAREEWYYHQEYNYEYGNDNDDEWEIDDGCFSSDDEE